jgi:hypothetical protein
MVSEQLLLSIYAILLIEIGLIFLIVIIILLDIKKTLDKLRNIVDKTLNLGNIAVSTVENMQEYFQSVSSLGQFVSFFSSLFSKKITKQGEDTEVDILSQTLQSIPKKKKRII